MSPKELGARYVSPVSAEHDRDACGSSYGETGITLRQHFAGLAMQGLAGSGYDSLLAAEIAVCHADALLAELAKDQP